MLWMWNIELAHLPPISFSITLNQKKKSCCVHFFLARSCKNTFQTKSKLNFFPSWYYVKPTQNITKYKYKKKGGYLSVKCMDKYRITKNMWKPHRREREKKVELGRFAFATNIVFKFCGVNCRRERRNF